jgi:signal transduction histidine kinase
MRLVEQGQWNEHIGAPPAALKPAPRRRTGTTTAESARRAAEQKAVQAERCRLARALHDGLTQDLAALGLRAGLALKLLPDRDEPATSELRGHLEAITAGLQHAIREARASVYALRAPDLDGRSVEEGLRILAARFESQTGLPVELCVEGQSPLRPGLACELALFRVTEEALNNVRRHAAACGVSVRLGWERVAVHLSIEDDGLGFDVEAPACTGAASFEGHFGLLSMRERVAALDGKLVIDSRPGAGTRVSAVFPLAGDVA